MQKERVALFWPGTANALCAALLPVVVSTDPCRPILCPGSRWHLAQDDCRFLLPLLFLPHPSQEDLDLAQCCR